MSDVCPLCRRPFKRSSGQNRYLWGVLYKAIADETGHSAQEIHEHCKHQFLPKMFVVLNGVEVETRKSTTELSTAEFSEYLDRVGALAGELGISLPGFHEEPLI